MVALEQWTDDETARLAQLIQKYGQKSWTLIAAEMGTRNSKQCRRRWKNFVAFPERKDCQWTCHEDSILLEAYSELGNRWTVIARRLVGRTDNAVKNRWTLLQKRDGRSTSRQVRGQDEVYAQVCAKLLQHVGTRHCTKLELEYITTVQDNGLVRVLYTHIYRIAAGVSLQPSTRCSPYWHYNVHKRDGQSQAWLQDPPPRTHSDAHSLGMYATASHPSSNDEGFSSDMTMTDAFPLTDDSHYEAAPQPVDTFVHQEAWPQDGLHTGALELLPLYDRFEQEVMGTTD